MRIAALGRPVAQSAAVHAGSGGQGATGAAIMGPLKVAGYIYHVPVFLRNAQSAAP
jgi:hypothetical protein